MSRSIRCMLSGQKHLNIDKRALEQVHKTVAGTDYDFEDEFGDEFGDETCYNMSLKAQFHNFILGATLT